MAKARSARVINRRGKKRGSLTYRTDREDKVSKIFIISIVCLMSSRMATATARTTPTKNVFVFYFGISYIFRSLQCVCRY